MDKKVIIISLLTSTIAAVAVCFIFLFFIYQPTQSNNALSSNKTTITERKEPETPISKVVDPSEVNSLSLETNYQGFYEENPKCQKNYQEMFGNNDGYYNENSPCKTTISINRDGSITKLIEISRYDKTVRKLQTIEKSVWAAKATVAQFNFLAKGIVGSDIFKNWNDGIAIYQSNSKITVNYKNQAREIMSNADEKTTAFLPLISAFKQLDKEIDWEKS